MLEDPGGFARQLPAQAVKLSASAQPSLIDDAGHGLETSAEHLVDQRPAREHVPQVPAAHE